LSMYKIHGHLNSSITANCWLISEFQEANTAEEALEIFLKENQEFDFFSKIIRRCSETNGKRWAEVRDQDAGHRIMAFIEEERCLT